MEPSNKRYEYVPSEEKREDELQSTRLLCVISDEDHQDLVTESRLARAYQALSHHRLPQ